MSSTEEKEIKISKNDFLVSKTDTKGVITYCNREFMQIAGYKESELIKKPHNIIRHKDMPKTVFKLLWSYIQDKREIFAFVKNRTKDGGYYWVYANVTASIGEDKNIVGYHSVRRKPSESAIIAIEKIYKILLEKEQVSVDNAMAFLDEFLADHELGYNEFIIGLQHESIRI